MKHNVFRQFFRDFCSAAISPAVFLLSLVLLVLLSAGCSREDEVSGKKIGKGGAVQFTATGGTPSATTKSSAGSSSENEVEQSYTIYYDFEKGENVASPQGGVSHGSDGNLTQSSDTRFSGEVFETTVSGVYAEYLDWVEGDKITIAQRGGSGSGSGYENLSSNYEVKNPTRKDDPKRSTATLTPVTGNGLQWRDGENYFAALYPDLGLTAVSTAGGSSSSYKASFSGTYEVMPSTQYCTLVGSRNYQDKTGSTKAETWYAPNMRYAYMAAGASGVSSSGTPLTLSFYPQFSSVEVKLVKPASLSEATVKLTGAVLTGGNGASDAASLSGSPQMTLANATGLEVAGGSAPSITHTPTTATYGSSITMNFKQSDGTTDDSPVLEEAGATGAKPVSFTFLMLPAGDLTQLELTLTLDIITNGVTQTETKKIKLKDADGWIPLPAGKKLTISNMSTWDLITYDIGDLLSVYTIVPVNGATFDLTESTFKSRKQVNNASWENVPYKFQYRESSSDEWTDGLPDWLSASGSKTGAITNPTYVNARTAGEKLSITVSPLSPTGETVDNTHTSVLETGEPKGKKLTVEGEDVYDLSYYNPATNENTTSQNTANCYVIRAPGTYQFPLVYGNIIKNGSVNTSSYERDASLPTGSEYLSSFVDHTGTPIGTGNHWIPNRFSGSSITAELIWQDSPGLIDPASIRIVNRNLVFNIPKATIVQGNALLAVKVGDDIAWSWHIWVTDRSLNVSGVSSGNSYRMLRYLGWCDTRKIKSYPARRCYIRIVQTEARGKSTKSQQLYGYPASVRDFSCLYYQWGRKDPYIGSVQLAYTGTNATSYYARDYSYKTKDCYNAGGTAFVFPSIENSNAPSLPDLIKKPNVFYDGVNVYAPDNIYFNLWDINHNPADDNKSASFHHTTKTIFDPCPVGFHIPSYFEITQCVPLKNKDTEDDQDYTGIYTWTQNNSSTASYPYITILSSVSNVTSFPCMGNKNPSGDMAALGGIGRSVFLHTSARSNGTTNNGYNYRFYLSTDLKTNAHNSYYGLTSLDYHYLSTLYPVMGVTETE